MANPSVATVLASVAGARADPATAQWLTQAMQTVEAEPAGLSVRPSLRSGAAGHALRVAFARCGRKLGADAVELGADHRHALEAAGAEVRPHWSARDYARAALLMTALHGLVPDEGAGVLQRLFRTAEIGEQQSILRVLGILPDPPRWAGLAAEATRTNAVDVFEALACENPYPARHMPDASFFQMVLKAIFVGLSTRRIEGLAARVTPELVRMVDGYASERRAAGRSVPDDVAYIEALKAEES